MNDTLETWLAARGLDATQITWVLYAVRALAVVLAAWVANFVGKKVLLRLVSGMARKTKTEWDNILVDKKFFDRLSHLAPAAVIWLLAPVVWRDLQVAEDFMQRAAVIYMLIVVVLVVNALLNAVDAIYQRNESARRISIALYMQIAKLVFAIGVGIVAVSILIGRSPMVLLTGLGALTAILLLIFKDTILGLVAGIQLAAHDMVRPGDWIEMPEFGVDGDVMEVGLNTVKVRNFDKTITTIPTYSLIASSFKNWRGMSDSGGRRIKRSIHIDVRSMRFCTPEMIERLRKIQVLRSYIESKEAELAEYNREHGVDDSVQVNGRRMTNLGTFRAYVVAYLGNHPKIHDDMTFLVRQLAPTELGLPLEVYVFSNDQRWVEFEAIQADIFDHLFAAIHEFDLRPFQRPSGSDVADLRGQLLSQGPSPGSAPRPPAGEGRSDP